MQRPKMLKDCCPECGHLLSKDRRECPFCRWDKRQDKKDISFRRENQFVYHDFRDWCPEQLHGF